MANNTASNAALVEPPDSDNDNDSELESELSMDDSEMTYDSAFDSPSPVYNSFESSYTSDVQDKRYRRVSGLYYDLCKPVELKQFVINRRLQDPYPQGITLKYYYLRKLEAADRHLSFRFMDLPPEMRLLIYRNLLVYGVECKETDRPAGTLYPQILRTSKIIHDEAKDIMYEENTFSASFRVVGGPDIRRVRVHNELINANCSHAKFTRLPQAIDDFPEHFRKVRKLRLCLGFLVDPDNTYIWRSANHFVYALSSFLMEGHQLRSLHLEVRLLESSTMRSYETLLYPLRRLRNIGSFTIDGCPHPLIESRLRSDFLSIEPSFNTMRHWKVLLEAATAQVSVLDAVHEPCSYCDCGECPVPDCMDELHAIMADIRKCSFESCLGARFEEIFMARLSVLRDCVNAMGLKELNRKIEELQRKRAALQDYENQTDDGRLEEAEMIWHAEAGLYDDILEYESGDEWCKEDEPAEPQKANMTVTDGTPLPGGADDGGASTLVTADNVSHPKLNSDQIEAILDEYADRAPSPEL